jgi:cell wall-associated NlpC family hydrolase
MFVINNKYEIKNNSPKIFFGAYWLLSLIIILTSQLSYAKNNVPTAITQPIPITQIPEYVTYSAIVQKLILKALRLSQMNLTYLYGSSDPVNKGMDCSGTIYYLLNQITHSDVPRQASEMFTWVKSAAKLYQITNADFDSVAFSELKPGDLLFWSGTYKTHRDPPITHVMLYLGKNQKGERLMFGASDGRTYQGKKMWGVSVFDFKLPDGKNGSRFVGYGCIPNLTC